MQKCVLRKYNNTCGKRKWSNPTSTEIGSKDFQVYPLCYVSEKKQQIECNLDTFKKVTKRLSVKTKKVLAYGFLPGDLNLVKQCLQSTDQVITFVMMQWLSLYTGGNVGYARDTASHLAQRTKAGYTYGTTPAYFLQNFRLNASLTSPTIIIQQEKGLFKFIWGIRNMMRNDFSYYGAYTSNSQAIYDYYGPGTCTEESKKQCYRFQYYPQQEWKAQKTLTQDFVKSRVIGKIGQKWHLFSGIPGEQPSQDREECMLKRS